MATTTKKPVTKKENTNAIENTTVIEESIVEETVETKQPVIKKYDRDELIPCRSTTPGLLLYNGPKSRIPYSWSNAGDITYVEYQDLLAAMASGSDYIFDPLFVIEDENVLMDPKWAEVKNLYESTDVNVDIKEILGLPVNKFRRALEQSPKGVLNAVKAEVSSQIAKGVFDSYQKVKIIDEVCGTDLKILMS